MEGIRRALVLGLVLIAGTAIEQAPFVGPQVINLPNISAGTGSVLRRCRPEVIWCDAAFRMMVRKILSLWLEAVICSACPLISLRYLSQFAFFKLKLVR